MNRKTRSLILAAAVTTALGAITMPGTAFANDIIGAPTPCTPVTDLVGPEYNVKLCGVSDVDQHRAGLHLDGAAYCGPTSLYNVMHYWAHEKNAPIGWVTTRVGNLDPRKPSDYGIVTNSIYRIGVDAKYDKGTNLNDLRKAWNIATKPARDIGWSTIDGNVSSANTPDFGGELAKRLAKGPVQMSYGRYYAGPQANTWQRNGGHIVTVVAAKGSFNGDTVHLKVADPGRAPDHLKGNYLKTQSAYELLDRTLKKVTFKEYVPVKDDPNTPEDESLKPGTYRDITRWEIVDLQPTPSMRVMVENFNWFDMAKPVG